MLIIAVLATLSACCPLALEAADAPKAKHPTGEPGSESAETALSNRRSDSVQVDPDAPFPPAPADRVHTVSVPVHLQEPAVSFRGVSRLAPGRAGDYFATETPSIAEHGPHGRGHRAEFRAPAVLPSAREGASGPVPPRSAAPRADAPKAPALSSSFDTTDTGTNIGHTGFVFAPADPIGAAGPDHLVNVVNVTLRFHQKNGTLDFDDDLAGFFSPLSPLTFTFDPKVIYDQVEGRFIVVTLEQTDTGAGDASDTSRIFVAVSDDEDPNGTWFVFDIDSKTNIGGTEHWADYPGLAADEEAIYITANMFEFLTDGGGYGGVRLWVIDKGSGSGGFYDGGTASVGVFDPYTGGGIETTTQPTHMYGVGPGGVGTFLVSWGGISNMAGDEAVQVVRVDDPLGAPSLSQSFVPVGDIDDLTAPLPVAPQDKPAADPVHSLATNDRRTLDATWFADSLWVTTTIDPKSGDPDDGEATAHWWEIDTGDVDSLTLADQGSLLGEDIATDTFTSFPAVAVNGAGQVAFGFSGSAATTQAGSHYTTHLPATAAGGNTGSATLRSGTAYYRRTFTCGTVSRWGDYSGMVVDPVDGCFWVYNKHAISRGSATTDCSVPADGTPDEDGRWGTAFGKFCPTGACPPDLLIQDTVYGSTVVENAGGQLLTSGTVTVGSGADVTYEAGQRISLTDGFSVQGGGSFTAGIVPCP